MPSSLPRQVYLIFNIFYYSLYCACFEKFQLWSFVNLNSGSFWSEPASALRLNLDIADRSSSSPMPVPRSVFMDKAWMFSVCIVQSSKLFHCADLTFSHKISWYYRGFQLVYPTLYRLFNWIVAWFLLYSGGKKMKRNNNPSEPQEWCKRPRKDQASLMYSSGATRVVHYLWATSMVNMSAGVGPESCVVCALKGLLKTVSAVLRVHCLMLIIWTRGKHGSFSSETLRPCHSGCLYSTCTYVLLPPCISLKFCSTSQKVKFSRFNYVLNCIVSSQAQCSMSLEWCVKQSNVCWPGNGERFITSFTNAVRKSNEIMIYGAECMGFSRAFMLCLCDVQLSLPFTFLVI